jgi:cytoskeletal protein RodZ
VHEDPTRMMGQPDDQRPHGNLRLLVAGLVAVIVGLVIAILVIANDSGGDGTTSTVTTVPSETASTTETTTGSTTETTAPTTTETTETTETTTTEPTTTVPPTEEEDPGSGGIPAP